jgi:hypothetical protein
MRATELSEEIRRLMTPRLSRNFSGPSPGIFVGSENYPTVNVGPLGMIDLVNDNPADWLGMDYREIIAIRGSVLRSGRPEHVKSKQKIIDNVQELSIASRPTDIEMIFQKKPLFSINFDRYVQPMGPFAKLELLRLQENPHVDIHVEKTVNDELKAAQAAGLLYQHGIDVYKITTILSSGILGFDKRLVPTRWSITATDDILAKGMMKEIRSFKSVNDFLVFESRKLDNHFTILMMPGAWEFENFEAWAKGSSWSKGMACNLEYEYEPFTGRTKYAMGEGGGYYASRLGIAEYLHRIRRQARVIVFREISEGYNIPLGVWQVRENVRNATSAEPKRFATKKEALDYVSGRIRYPLQMYLQNSKILSQRRLNDF